MLSDKKVIPQLGDSGELSPYSPCQVQLSSKERGWKNILLTRFVHDAQYLVSSPRPATPDHSIVMLDAGAIKGQFSDNQGRYRPCNMHKGDWIIGQAFENHFDGFGDIQRDKGQEFATLVIHLSPKLLAMVEADVVGIDNDKIELSHQIKVRDPLMTKIANLLKTQLYHGNIYGQVYAETAAHMLAAHLLKNYCVQRKRLPEVKGRISGNRIGKVLDYIQENLHEEISIEGIAKVAHMSPFYFIKVFKKHLGKTPYQFIVYQRMGKAKHLLRNTNRPVIQFALETGYSYACNFSIAFKQSTGMSPINYRKSH